MNERLEAAARLYEDAAKELEHAARHCEVAAGHFRDNEVPRGTAHAWAARGHVLEAEARLDPRARGQVERLVGTVGARLASPSVVRKVGTR